MVATAPFMDGVKKQLVFDPGVKHPITSRTAFLREEVIRAKPKIFSERGALATDSMRETEGEPMIIRRAKVLEKVLNGMSLVIWPGELIVGNHAPERRGAPVFPEFGMHTLVDELDGNPVRPDQRPADRFLIDEQDEAAVRKFAPWWKGRTIDEYKLKLLPLAARKAYFEQAVFSTTQGAAGAVGHLIVDYRKLLQKGLAGIIQEVKDELAKVKSWEAQEFQKRYFYEALIISLQATIDFSRRYGQLARHMAAAETNQSRAAELVKIAENCEWVPANPARTFWEAAQSVWIVHLAVQLESNGHSVSFGRFDQYMYPFYEGDKAAGRITPEAALELTECLWIKSMELNKFRCWPHTRVLNGYPMFQNVTLAGKTKDGRSAINELSWLGLEATANLKLPSPSVSVRFWPGMPEGYFLKCLETINMHRGGQPALYNDDAIIPAQLSMGVSMDEAYDYALCSCVQPAQPGRGVKPGNFVSLYNLPKIFEIAINNGRDPRSGVQIHPNLGNKDLTTFESFEELKEAVKEQIRFYHKVSISAVNCVAKAFAELAPTPLVSALMDDCILRGLDVQWGGGRYSAGGWVLMGTISLGNCLAALKKVMFEDKALTAQQIKHAIETNFEDKETFPSGEEIRQMLLHAPKFGNDDDYVDLLVKEMFEFICKEANKFTIYATNARASCNTAETSAHVAAARNVGATPDGRKSGTPANDGISPQMGTDVSGPTATLNSVAKLNHALCANGTLLNQKFSPASFQNAAHLRAVSSLLRTYFSLKGMHVQVNVASAETLRDAQKHPEKYRGLLVRVTGYSALFTELDPEVQDDIIARTEQSCE